MAEIKKVKLGIKKSMYTPSTSTGALGLSLPSTASTPATAVEAYTWLIYGERKIGKTTLCSQFDDPFFLMFEPGGKALNIRQVAVPTWDHFMEYISLLEKNPGYCKTVVIDTGYMAYESCLVASCKELGIQDPRDEAWGKAWKFIDKKFREAHQRILNLNLGFIVTAHSEVKTIQRRDGTSYDKLSTQLSAQAFRFYCGVVDTIAYYQYGKNGERELTIRGDDHVEAGTRCKGHFLDKNGKPNDTIPMGNSEEEAYKNLCLAFDNKLNMPQSGGGHIVARKKVDK